LCTFLCCTKWPPELKIEKSCPAFTGQTAGGISQGSLWVKISLRHQIRQSEKVGANGSKVGANMEPVILQGRHAYLYQLYIIKIKNTYL
jgi:hypothetical protein